MNFQERVNALKKILIEKEIDCFLINGVSSIGYFSGFFDVSLAFNFLLIPKEGVLSLFVSKVSYELAKEKAKDCIIELIEKPDQYVDAICEKVLEIKAKNIAFDRIPLKFYLKLKRRTKAKIKPKPEFIWKLRRVKCEEEIDCLRKAAEIVDKGMEIIPEILKPGLSEYEIAGEIEHEIRRRGCEAYSFDTIVASGSNSAYPHAICTDRTIKEGDIVLIDIGATYKGYRSNITRTFILGKPSNKQIRMHKAVLKAQTTAINSIKHGVFARTICKRSERILEKEGYKEYIAHGIGHGIGLDVHEPPSLSPFSKDKLEKGNVITIEPAIYIKDFGGIRIEDMVLVKEDKGTVLTAFPRELI